MPRTPKYFMHIYKPFHFAKGIPMPFLEQEDFLLYEKTQAMECMLITSSDTLVQILQAKFSSLQFNHLTYQQSHIEIATPKEFEHYIGNLSLITKISTN